MMPHPELPVTRIVMMSWAPAQWNGAMRRRVQPWMRIFHNARLPG